MYVWIYSVLVGLYIINQIFPSLVLSYIVGILAVIAIGFSVRRASGLYLITGTSFLLIGSIFFFYLDLPWHTFFLYFESMMGLLAFFFMLPFISTLIHIGHFDTQLNHMLNLKTTQLSQLYRRSSLVSHILGIFLNVATAPLLFKSLSPSLASVHDTSRNQFYTRSILRGYALCLTWSPLEVLLGMSIDATGVKYYHIFPIMFTLAILFILFDWYLFSKDKNSDWPIPSSDFEPHQMQRIKRKLIQLMSVLLLLALAVSLVDHWLGFGFLFSLVLVIVPFTLTAAFLMKKSKQYMTISVPYWRQRAENLSNFFFMFLSAGLFVEMVTQTQGVIRLQSFLAEQTETVLIFYVIIGIYFVLCSLGGFHPLISLALMIQMLTPIFDQLPALPTALVLISCSLASGMYSPFNISVSVLSSEMRVNPFRITQWNIGFALCYMIVSISVAYWIHMIG